MRNTNAKTIEIHKYSISGEYIESYKTIADASRDVGVSSSAIVNNAKGKTKTSAGYVWRYDKSKGIEPTNVSIGSVQPSYIFKNASGLEYKVISKEYNENNQDYYLVEFLESRYRTIKSYSVIRSGGVKDPMSPSVYGIGFIGSDINTTESNGSRRAYHIWSDMIRRCYNEDDDAYIYYGSLGVSVCDRWHNFSLFKEDLPFVEGYDYDKFYNNEIVLDKDIKQWDIPTNEKIYSRDTCKFVTRRENSLDARIREGLNKDGNRGE